MKKIVYFAIPLVIILVIALRLKNNKEIAQSRIYRYDKEQSIAVKVDTLRSVVSNAQFLFAGNFEPDKETRISAEVQGKVTHVFVDVGSVVKKGQALVKLDDDLLRLQLQTVEVQIEGLEADIKRFSVLAASDAIQGVQLEKAQLGLKSAEIQRSTLQEQISRTTIVAPFNGVITAKLTEAGAFAAPGIPVIQLTDIATIRFTIQVPENDLRIFKVKQEVEVTADAFPTLRLTASTSLIGSKGNIGNTFPIQFVLKNTSDLKIKSGMFGKVKAQENSNSAHLQVPTTAIVGSAIQPQVYVIENGKAELRNIIVSDRIRDHAIVQAGLKAGDIVVTSGLINLFEGANVAVN